MGQVEKIFKNLPKRLEWRSFFNNDLPLITDICEEIRKISVENQLNKSQTKEIHLLPNFYCYIEDLLLHHEDYSLR